MADTPLDKLRSNPKNPRTISRAKAAALKKALTTFGDLGGIIFNRTSGQLLGGHQRVNAWRNDPHVRTELTTQYQTPTRTGTVAEGFIFSQGERFSYREVEWDAKTEKAASIACNSSAGAWDITGLTAWLTELNSAGFDMDATMFTPEELQPYLPKVSDLTLTPEPQTQMAPQPDSAKETFDPVTGEVSASAAAPADRDAAPPVAKLVSLFFYDDATYQKFLDLTDGLKEAYKRDNLSDTVFEAVKRASISVAL